MNISNPVDITHNDVYDTKSKNLTIRYQSLMLYWFGLYYANYRVKQLRKYIHIEHMFGFLLRNAPQRNSKNFFRKHTYYGLNTSILMEWKKELTVKLMINQELINKIVDVNETKN